MIDNLFDSVNGYDFGNINIAQTVEYIVVVAILLLLVPFIIAKISQLRLLNRFFKTPAGPIWIVVSVLLLVVTLGAGAWYFLL